ncbi:MAG TPA: DUF3347 domain-containing protein [Chitinophagaceae bacterium]|nr:DUF3347 domain-containing protein [Chitinophagaceae bacterium]
MKILDILAVILPLILIVFGFLRVGDDKTPKASTRIKTLNGLTMLIAIVLLLIGGVRYFFFPGSGGASHASGAKPVPIKISKHSDLFNNSVGDVLNAYYSMTEAFVNWDSAGVNKHGSELVNALTDLKTEELKNDTSSDAQTIYLTTVDMAGYAKTDASNIVQQSSLDKKREALNALTDNLRNLFITVKYDREKIYYQECPMAFGDDKPGYWLSKTKEVRNPYLGNKHPEYKDDMLTCGEPKDTINFIPVDTTMAK